MSGEEAEDAATVETGCGGDPFTVSSTSPCYPWRTAARWRWRRSTAEYYSGRRPGSGDASPTRRPRRCALPEVAEAPVGVIGTSQRAAAGQPPRRGARRRRTSHAGPSGALTHPPYRHAEPVQRAADQLRRLPLGTDGHGRSR